MGYQGNFVLLPNTANIKDKTSHSDFSMSWSKKRLNVRRLVFEQKPKTSIRQLFPVRTNLPWGKDMQMLGILKLKLIAKS